MNITAKGAQDRELFIQNVLETSLYANRTLAEAAFDGGLNLEGTISLFDTIYKIGGRRGFLELKKVLKSVARHGLTPQQTTLLLDYIIQTPWNCSAKLIHFSKILPVALRAELSPDQIINLYGRIAEAAGVNTMPAFHTLPAALKSRLSLDQFADLISRIVNNTGTPTQAQSVFCALPAALQARLSPDQIIDLISSIAINDNSSYSFNCLKEALEVAKITLAPEQIIDLFKRIAQIQSTTVFTAIPAVLQAQLSPDQIMDLFTRITTNFGCRYSYEAFRVLPAALQARLSPDQIIDFFSGLIDLISRITKDAVPNIVLAFRGLPAALQAQLSPEQIMDLFSRLVRNTSMEYNELALSALPAALQARLSPDQAIDLICRILQTAGISVLKAFSALFANLTFADLSSRDAALSRFFSMLNYLTDYNREMVLELLANRDSIKIYQRIGPANFLPHYNLYMDTLISRKKLGFALLEGLLEAEEVKSIPQKLFEKEVALINTFIDQLNSFSPLVYQVYRREGEALLAELRSLARQIIGDGLGVNEIKAAVDRYAEYNGLEFLAAVIQISIPLSGTSFVKRSEIKYLLQQSIAAGDLRTHIPPALRGQTRQVELGRMIYSLRDGQELDLTDVAPILAGLRTELKADEGALVQALEAYLHGDRSKASRENVRQALYRFASRRDLLGEKVDRLGNADYYTLRLLEEIFRDKDCLQSILVRAIDQLPSDLLAADKVGLTHPEALARAMNKMWSGPGSSNEKIRRLTAMTAKYQADDLRKLTTSGRLEPEIASTLNESLKQENQAYISKHKLAATFLATPLRAIQREKAKFELKADNERGSLHLQMVKGIPFSLWGLCAGVCVATDFELWKDPNFKLVAMIDEENKNTVGFIHVYEVTTSAGRFWSLPGINPSTEFIGTVNPNELYDRVMESVISLAQEAGDIQGIYLPTDPSIHSNRSDVQRVIRDKNYPTRTIPVTHWSRQQHYPFSEVYVVWEK